MQPSSAPVTASGSRRRLKALPTACWPVVDRLVADLLVEARSARRGPPPFANHDIAAALPGVSRRRSPTGAPVTECRTPFRERARARFHVRPGGDRLFQGGGLGRRRRPGRGVRIAWHNRERLGPRDRALLDNYTGPRYPAQNFSRSNIQSAERLVQLAPTMPRPTRNTATRCTISATRLTTPIPGRWPGGPSSGRWRSTPVLPRPSTT